MTDYIIRVTRYRDAKIEEFVDVSVVLPEEDGALHTASDAAIEYVKATEAIGKALSWKLAKETPSGYPLRRFSAGLAPEKEAPTEEDGKA